MYTVSYEFLEKALGYAEFAVNKEAFRTSTPILKMPGNYKN